MQFTAKNFHKWKWNKQKQNAFDYYMRFYSELVIKIKREISSVHIIVRSIGSVKVKDSIENNARVFDNEQ